MLGNEGYDVLSVDLALDVRPWFGEGSPIVGVATLTIEPTLDLDSFVVDVGTLDVRSVAVDGDPTPIDRDVTQLRIDPDPVLLVGEPVDVTIDYLATVPDGGDYAPGQGGITSTEGGLFAVGEPIGATTWRPANDHPSDKATYEISITTPPGVVAAAGGIAADPEEVADGVVWRFTHAHPVASYLVPLAVGDLVIVDHPDDDLDYDLRDYVDEDVDASEALLARQRDIVVFFEGLLGPYPFDAVGSLVVDRAFWGALETQTLATYAPNAFADFVVAHEIAHQWVGNSVTLSDWSDIWLNEGFATYLEWLWVADADIRSLEDSVLRGHQRTAALDPGFGPGEPPPQDLFNRIVYERGALTLHALRVEVGDETFFEILREWVDRYAYGNATTADFISLAEELSGTQLDGLFDAWLFGELPPLPTTG